MALSRYLGAVLAAGALFNAAALAAESDWTLTLGLEGRVLPNYPGSDSYLLAPVPLFDLRRAGTIRHFTNPRDGLGIGLYEGTNFRAGITGKVQLPRYQSDDASLAGLGDVGWAFEPGLFVEYWPVPWLRTRAEIRQGIGGHHGQIGDLSADLVVPVTPALTLSGGPRLTLATQDALQPYFGVTAAQAAATTYPVYTPSGGVRSYGAGGMARYEWSPQWATHIYVEYDRLASAAADSPIVMRSGSPDQVQVGIGATYSFDIKAPFDIPLK